MPGTGQTLVRTDSSSLLDPGSPTVRSDSAVATPSPGRLVGYVFNAASRDVTLFDPATREVLATIPLGAVVRWLSNEQRFWDGSHIWTYDFPDDEVQAVAVDPHVVTVARVLPTGGKGPAHSLMLTPDRKTAWVNVAGEDSLVALDLDSGEIAAEIKTGKFP
jgi:DNA-binding beta-propeller fold protein YncE